MFRFSIFEHPLTRISNKLTESSNYKIDWSRSATGNSKLMLIGPLLLAVMASYCNDKDQTNISDFSVFLLIWMISLSLSHIPHCLRLRAKRNAISDECERLINDIESFIIKNDICYSHQVVSIVDDIMEIKISDHLADRASQTWGMRKRLLENVLQALDKENDKFWLRENKLIIKALNAVHYNKKHLSYHN